MLSSDTSKLKIDTKVNLGGKPMPFPADKLISIFGKPESVLGYKCEDGKLFLKPQIDNVDSPWQRLASRVNHWGMYALLICVPIAG